MSRDHIYLMGMGLGGIISFAILILVVSNVMGILLVLAIGCGLGLAANHFYPSPYEHDRVQATVVGLGGTVLGNWLHGVFPFSLLDALSPHVKGVSLLPSLLGAVVVIFGLRYKATQDRIKTLEAYKAKAEEDSLVLSLVEDQRLIGFLGSGAFSRVYKAVPDRTLNEREAVAVKVFNDNALKSEGFVERMQREVALCQSLNHPHIVRTFKSGEQEKVHYLVMEFVAGETLASRLARGPMGVMEAVKLIREIATGLGHAHSKGVVHRDIKPENILLSENGPKIMDFGLARLAGTSTLTQSGSAIGTPHYMSPEQVVEEKNLDGRCDQYSLGCVGFEMLTGQKLFDGEQAVLVVMKHVQEEPRNPCSVNPDVPKVVGETIVKMLAKKRDDRYPNLEEVVEALSKVIVAR